MQEKEYYEAMQEAGLKALMLSYEERVKRVGMSNKGVSTDSIREVFISRLEKL